MWIVLCMSMVLEYQETDTKDKFIMQFQKIYPRDIIAFISLIAIFILIGMGHNGWLQGVGAVIIGYYFSKRVYEENNK